MNSSFTMRSSVTRVLLIMLLASLLLAGFSVAIPAKTAFAGGTTCDSWVFRGCCESWWPCRQDFYSRNCWNDGAPPWEEWSCNVISECDYGC